MFKRFIFILLTTIISISAYSQTNSSSAVAAHRKAHSEQLAAINSSKMDRSVIKDLLKEDISKRESEIALELSAANKQLVSDLLAEANKHIGKPYRHGMKGPNAFDCSGFTSYVYKQFGYTISPASRVQFTDGQQVDRKSLKKGDLVFFTSRNSGKNVGHVGIVTSADNENGNFEFIHASIRGVKVSSVTEPYYSKRYVGARRIITE